MSLHNRWRHTKNGSWKRFIIVIIIFGNILLGFFCFSSSGSNNVLAKKDTIIYFSKHIRVVGHRSKEFGWTSFNPIEIFLDENQIFRDTKKEYWLSGLESNQYPRLLECVDGSFQLLIEVDERPNQNELQLFSISKNGQIQHNEVPIFNWNPRDIDHNGKLEVMGVLTNGETIAKGDTALYNPTLVYELSNRCLMLDSSATIKINETIWGKFHGYYYNDSLLLPFKRKIF